MGYEIGDRVYNTVRNVPGIVVTVYEEAGQMTVRWDDGTQSGESTTSRKTVAPLLTPEQSWGVLLACLKPKEDG